VAIDTRPFNTPIIPSACLHAHLKTETHFRFPTDSLLTPRPLSQRLLSGEVRHAMTAHFVALGSRRTRRGPITLVHTKVVHHQAIFVVKADVLVIVTHKRHKSVLVTPSITTTLFPGILDSVAAIHRGIARTKVMVLTRLPLRDTIGHVIGSYAKNGKVFGTSVRNVAIKIAATGIHPIRIKVTSSGFSVTRTLRRLGLARTTLARTAGAFRVLCTGVNTDSHGKTGEPVGAPCAV